MILLFRNFSKSKLVKKYKVYFFSSHWFSFQENFKFKKNTEEKSLNKTFPIYIYVAPFALAVLRVFIENKVRKKKNLFKVTHFLNFIILNIIETKRERERERIKAQG
jgi:hypothetical protein